MNAFDLLPIVAIGLVVYFLMWRPQQQEKEAQQNMLSSLQKDDEIVTIGGIHGSIVEVGGATLVLSIAEKTHVTIEKTAVARKISAAVGA